MSRLLALVLVLIWCSPAWAQTTTRCARQWDGSTVCETSPSRSWGPFPTYDDMWRGTMTPPKQMPYPDFNRQNESIMRQRVLQEQEALLREQRLQLERQRIEGEIRDYAAPIEKFSRSDEWRRMARKEKEARLERMRAYVYKDVDNYYINKDEQWKKWATEEILRSLTASLSANR